MSGFVRFCTALAGALLAGCLGAGAAVADTPGGDDAPARPPQEAVAVPYLGETEITPAAPWRVARCPDAPAGLLVACRPDRVTLTAEGFDPAWGEPTLTVGLDGPLGALDVAYRVLLAPPEPPAAETVLWDAPVASGAQVLIPLAALGVTCKLCTPGEARLEVGVAEPESAAVATATGSHVAVRTTPGFTGDLAVPVRVVDDAGQAGGFSIVLRVGPVPAEPFGALHVLVPVEADGSASIDLAALAWPESLPGAIAECSAALAGMVACAGGVATYTAPEGDALAGSDQFAVRLVAPDGRIARGSVTLEPAGTAPALAPVAGGTSAPLRVLLPAPPEEGAAPAASVFGDLAPAFTRSGLTG